MDASLPCGVVAAAAAVADERSSRMMCDDELAALLGGKYRPTPLLLWAAWLSPRVPDDTAPKE